MEPGVQGSQGEIQKVLDGVAWSILNPLMMIVMIYVVFSNIFKAETKNFAAYIIVGVLIWQYVVNATSPSTRVFLDNSDTLKWTRLPLFVFPLATTISSAVNLFLLIPTYE